MSTFALRSVPREPRRPAAGPLVAWAALLFNVLTFLGPTPLVPLPTFVGQLLTQLMLPVALLLVLLANPGCAIRFDPLLALLTVVSVVALMVSLHNEFLFGSVYRGIRFLGFVAVLWAFTFWWGRPGMPILRAHLTCLRVLVGSVLAGALAFPGAAFSPEGRLQGAIWPIPPPQVAHYAAVLLGATVVLWFCRLVRGRTAVITLVATGAALIESHTRTALLGCLVGLVAGGAGLFVSHARVRRTAAALLATALVVTTFLSGALLSWLSRGQSAEDTAQLTGRTKVWTAVLAQHRSWTGEWFGSGLSNKSFNGLPIDSNWISTYWDEGRLGTGLQIAYLGVLLLLALTRPRGAGRAVALFLVSYCLTVSFTETGLGDASTYLLDLAAAASLLARPPTGELGHGGPYRRGSDPLSLPGDRSPGDRGRPPR